MLSFRNRLLILLIGLVVGAETVTLFTALPQTAKNERSRADNDLKKGARNALQRLDYQEKMLSTTGDVLVKDAGLRSAFGSQDGPTLASALTNHAQRFNADLIFALDTDGKLLAHGKTAPVDEGLVEALQQDQQHSDSAARFVKSASGLYQMFIKPMLAPDEIGQVVIGFAVDQKLAEELQKQVDKDVEVAFVSNDAGTPLLLAGTPALQQADFTIDSALPNEPAVVRIGRTEYLATTRPLGQPGSSFQIALLKPMDKVMQPYRELEWIFIRIIGLTLAAAIIAGIYLGRTATRPVQRLAAGASRIAAGDYSQPIEASGGQELAHLAESFNSMQNGIAERESKLVYVSRHDAATGLPNRLRMEEWLTLRLKSGNAPLVVVQLVITNLQEISATLGFEIAESLVSHLAGRLKDWIDDRGLVARFDTATFAVAIEPNGLEPEAIAQQLLLQSSSAFTTAGITLKATVVLGVTIAPRDAVTSVEVLRCAHAAVEAAILQRTSMARFAASSDQAQHRRLRLGADLPAALASGQLFLHYQPKTRMRDRRICGVEALVRWQHPEFGPVSPAEFIPIAENTGTSAALTRWVLQSALAQLAAWHRNRMPLEMAVNLSAADVLDTQLLQYILEALSEVKVPAGSLTLEITESVLMHEPAAARRNMEMLRVAGVRFSIDDFGTGYSSLSQLRELAADELKIDQSFVRGSRRGPEQVAVLRAIIDMAHGLGLRTVAEGVETEEHWQMLANLGCNSAQGYLISRPVPAAELLPLLQANGVARHDSNDRTASLRVLELRRRET